MIAIYNVLLPFLLFGARLAAIFNPKIRRGLAGRKSLLEEIRTHYASTTIQGLRILIHVASFGELEQAKPVISALKARNPAAHIHLTFFSPSGYENAIGKYMDPDLITYAPLDMRSVVSRFLNMVKPDLVLFTRYDVWPNMARELNRRNITAILFTATAAEGVLRKIPIFGGFYRDTFRSLTKILAVSDEDRERFLAMGLEPDKVEVAGDTRFDQVLARRNAINASGEQVLPKMTRDKIAELGTLVLVVGSSWPSDEALYFPALKESVERNDNILTIVAPHETGEERVRKLLAEFPGNALRLSSIEEWAGEPVIVVDSIGKLFGLYRYADVAMIGGGFGAGLHNILEAAVWGVPTIVGPRHEKSREVATLIDRIAAFEIKTTREFDFVFWRLAKSEDLRETAGAQATHFVEENTGATARIIHDLS